MRLRPFVALGLVLLPLIVLCTWLGFWQLQRMHEKQDLFDRFERSREMSLAQAIATGNQFARVRVNGRYNLSWHLLLDNKVLRGRAGVHILTLFEPDDGPPILVNRGWLPLPPDRSRLPAIPTPPGHLGISGILKRAVDDGVRLGEPEDLQGLAGPRLVTYLDIATLSAATGMNLSPWLIQLDADDDTGFEGREWKPAVMSPAQHRAYAIQWFGLGAALAIIWLTLTLKRHRPSNAATGARLDDPEQHES